MDGDDGIDAVVDLLVGGERALLQLGGGHVAACDQFGSPTASWRAYSSRRIVRS